MSYKSQIVACLRKIKICSHAVSLGTCPVTCHMSPELLPFVVNTHVLNQYLHHILCTQGPSKIKKPCVVAANDGLAVETTALSIFVQSMYLTNLPIVYEYGAWVTYMHKHIHTHLSQPHLPRAKASRMSQDDKTQYHDVNDQEDMPQSARRG